MGERLGGRESEPSLLAQLSFGEPTAVLATGEAASLLGIMLRPASNADIPLLFEIYVHTRLDELAVTGWPDAAKMAFLEQQFAAQHQYYQANYDRTAWLVIDHRGLPAGRLYVAQWNAEIRVIDIALLPAARGRGIGGAVLADLVVLSGRCSKPLTVHVERNNPARHLYLRHGFIPASDAGIYEMMRRSPDHT